MAIEGNIKKQEIALPQAKIIIITVPLMIFILGACFMVYYVFNGLEGFLDLKVINIMIYAFLPVFVVGAVLHELIHGWAFSFFGHVPFSSIKFGFDDKSMAPYTYCKVPVTAKVLKLSLIMPALLLGIIPGIISIWAGNIYIFSFAAVFTAAASSDFIVLWLIRNVNNRAMVEDHPDKSGCFVLLN